MCLHLFVRLLRPALVRATGNVDVSMPAGTSRTATARPMVRVEPVTTAVVGVKPAGLCDLSVVPCPGRDGSGPGPLLSSRKPAGESLVAEHPHTRIVRVDRVRNDHARLHARTQV